MKIFIAVPTFENIYPDTYKSIYGLDPCGHQLVFDFVRGYDVATARNKIAQQSMDEGADYVLMVDNDVVLPSNTLRYLLEDPKEVCLGYYAHRVGRDHYDGLTILCKMGEFNYTQLHAAAEIKALRDSGTYKFQVHGGGMGCAFIKTDVFRRIKYPWYDWVNYENKGQLSEDLYFCEQLKNAGIPVYADTRVACGHLFRAVVWPW